ncbi:MAG: SEC-C domain-containing protein, partial [Deltaproteobacteria bacterium]|nr:SEC-C domain-containing protein [Deltaproteobacteria bacterium]
PAGPRRQAPAAARAPGDAAAPQGKVGRNDPCPCGSGHKYKKCHGAAA